VTDPTTHNQYPTPVLWRPSEGKSGTVAAQLTDATTNLKLDAV
jgi:hypothetical protein